MQFVVKGIRSVEAVGSQVTIFISELKAFDEVRRVFNPVVYSLYEFIAYLMPFLRRDFGNNLEVNNAPALR